MAGGKAKPRRKRNVARALTHFEESLIAVKEMSPSL